MIAERLFVIAVVELLAQRRVDDRLVVKMESIFLVWLPAELGFETNVFLILDIECFEQPSEVCAVFPTRVERNQAFAVYRALRGKLDQIYDSVLLKDFVYDRQKVSQRCLFVRLGILLNQKFVEFLLSQFQIFYIHLFVVIFHKNYMLEFLFV